MLSYPTTAENIPKNIQFAKNPSVKSMPSKTDPKREHS